MPILIGVAAEPAAIVSAASAAPRQQATATTPLRAHSRRRPRRGCRPSCPVIVSSSHVRVGRLSSPAPAEKSTIDNRSDAMPTVVILGTLDTKGPELAYLRDRVRDHGVEALLVDVGVFEPQVEPDV